MNQDKIWSYFQTDGAELFLQSVPRLKLLFREAARFGAKRKLNVLNIGIGDGWLERGCLKQGWETHSLDPIESAVKQLREIGVKAETGQIEAIPFGDDRFDVVFCSEVLEHLSTEQIQKGLREIQRVLKNSGVLLGTVPFQENLFEGRVVCPACGNVFHRIGHQQTFDLQTLKAAFPATLTVERAIATYFYDWPRLNWKGKVLVLMKRGLLFAGVHGANEHIYFVARKALPA
jgi:ubiquinone/menaquinone biosynthesis C-methylase UbiE